MKRCYPPDPLTNLVPHPIFLAGSIEMGMVEDWQEVISCEIEARLDPDIFCILNPRRKDWESSWEQSKNHSGFHGQVEWELEGLEKSKSIIMYLHPETKAPVSLLELGLHARSGKLLVICPPGYYRKGNVDIVCERYGIRQFETFKEVIEYLNKHSI